MAAEFRSGAPCRGMIQAKHAGSSNPSGWRADHVRGLSRQATWRWECQNVWPAPSASGFFGPALSSLRQRIRSRGSHPGQDGEPRTLVLINLPASMRHFCHQGSRAPVRLSGHLASTSCRHHGLPACGSAVSRSALHRHSRGADVEYPAAAQHRPGDPCQLVRQGDDSSIRVHPRCQPAQPGTK